MNAPRNFVIRASYTKRGKVRFTSHRDVARLFERAIRIVGVPVAYSEGFSPRPRLSFGLALPTTFESDAEYVDMVLEDPLDPAPFVGPLSDALPEGIAVTDVAVLTPGAMSLQEVVDETVWELDVKGSSPEQVAEWTQSVLDQKSITITQERKGKESVVDVRPAILSLACNGSDGLALDASDGLALDASDGLALDASDGLALHASDSSQSPVVTITAELATKPRALRPAELLGIDNPSFELVRGCRTYQWTISDGARRDPIAAGAAQESAHGMARAS